MQMILEMWTLFVFFVVFDVFGVFEGILPGCFMKVRQKMGMWRGGPHFLQRSLGRCWNCRGRLVELRFVACLTGRVLSCRVRCIRFC